MIFSIIVPVYNAANYLKRCLDSILSQDFNGKFEVIIIDDCSTDNSSQIIKLYSSKYTNIKIIRHKTNRRLAGARTSGMQISTGEYTMHVDADDELLPNALKNLYHHLLKYKPDVLVFNYVIKNNERLYHDSKFIKNIIETKNKDIIQKYFYGSCWNKVVRTKLTKDLVYSVNMSPKSTEDLIYCTEILLKSNQFLLINETYYKYFIHKESITQKNNPINYICNQTIIIDLIQLLIQKYSPNKKIVNNLLRYFSKYIFLSILQIHLYNIKKNNGYIRDLYYIINNDLLENKYNKELMYSNHNFLISIYYCMKYYSAIFTIKYLLKVIIYK